MRGLFRWCPGHRLSRKHELPALAWLADERSTAPFSFRWCCDVPDVDATRACAQMPSTP